MMELIKYLGESRDRVLAFIVILIVIFAGVTQIIRAIRNKEDE